MSKLPINLSVRNNPGVIRLSSGSIQLVGNPAYLRVLINPTTKEIGFQASNMEDPKALKICYGAHKAVLICSKLLADRLFDLCDWNKDSSYRTLDCYLSPENILMFKLQSAKESTRKHL